MEEPDDSRLLYILHGILPIELFGSKIDARLGIQSQTRLDLGFPHRLKLDSIFGTC